MQIENSYSNNAKIQIDVKEKKNKYIKNRFFHDIPVENHESCL